MLKNYYKKIKAIQWNGTEKMAEMIFNEINNPNFLSFDKFDEHEQLLNDGNTFSFEWCSDLNFDEWNEIFPNDYIVIENNRIKCMNYKEFDMNGYNSLSNNGWINAKDFILNPIDGNYLVRIQYKDEVSVDYDVYNVDYRVAKSLMSEWWQTISNRKWRKATHFMKIEEPKENG